MINILAACVVLLKMPFLFLGFLIKHKALLVIVIVAIIGVAVFKTLHKTQPETITGLPIPYYQQIEPSLQKAPNVIQTVSPDRIYYTGAFTDDGKTIVLAAGNFYMYNKDKWEVGKLPLYLDRGNYGSVVIYKR